MLTQKFSHVPSYFNVMYNWRSAYVSPKDLAEETNRIYQETAQLLYDMGYIKEAKNILLQIGETRYCFRLRSQAPKISLSKIDIPHCLGML